MVATAIRHIEGVVSSAGSSAEHAEKMFNDEKYFLGMDYGGKMKNISSDFMFYNEMKGCVHIML